MHVFIATPLLPSRIGWIEAAPIQLGSPSNADVAAAKAQLTAMLQQFEEEQGDTNTVDGAEEAVVVASTAPIAVPEIATPQPVAVAAPAPTARDGWKIQIGALPSQTAASERLAAARDQFARLLAQAEPYTEPVAAGSTTLYRARFAGFETQAAARAACAQIKKRAYDCLPVLQ